MTTTGFAFESTRSVLCEVGGNGEDRRNHGGPGLSQGGLRHRRDDPLVSRVPSISDEYRPEIVHIGESRTTDHLIVERLEEAVGVVFFQSGARRQAESCGALASVSGPIIAPATSSAPSTPSVSADSACTSGMSVQRQRKGEEKLDIAAAASLTTKRNGRFAAREQDTGWLEGLPAGRNLARDPRQHGPDLTRLTLDGVTKDVGGIAGVPGDLGRGFEGQLRRGDQGRLDGLQPRVVRFDALSRAALQQPPRGLGQSDAVARNDLERVAAGRRVGDGRPGCDVDQTGRPARPRSAD